jgi:hypothetical protein
MKKLGWRPHWWRHINVTLSVLSFHITDIHAAVCLNICPTGVRGPPFILISKYLGKAL